MEEGALPKYKAMNPDRVLEEMNEFTQKIKSGEFKLVGFKGETKNEVLILPNPGGKDHTKATGKQVKTLEITICNQVE